MTNQVPTSGENFTLASLMDDQAHTWDERFRQFGVWSDRVQGLGFVMRQVDGAAGPVVPVREPGTDTPNETIMLGSNNYLSIANEPEIVTRTAAVLEDYGIGCGGPPLLNGMTAVHRALERRLAEWKGCESAMVFSSGYGANVGWVSGMFQAGDVLVYDEQSHASLYDGIQLGRVRALTFEHNDMDHLEHRLMQVRWRNPGANVMVAVEGVYSMNGDIAPLEQIRSLCDKYDAWLAIDDAHGTGVLGARGHGTAEHFGLEGRIEVAMGTFSKTFTTVGGFVAGSRRLVDYLRFFARSYMFSATLPPHVAGSVLASMDWIDAHPERIRALHDNTALFASLLGGRGFAIEHQTAIIPIRVPEPVSIPEVVADLQHEGVFVNGVEYPAVPRDQQRLRVSIQAGHTADQLTRASDAIETVARRHGFLPPHTSHTSHRTGAA